MGLTQRQTKIIAILNRTREYTTVAALADELQVSKRTIHNDLNTMIRDSDTFLIEKKQGTGIRIQWLKQDHDIHKNHETLRILDIFRTLLFDEQTVTVQELAELYFVSPTSILKDLNTIRNEWLNEATVMLQSDNHGTRLAGSEEQFWKTLIVFNEMVMKCNARQYQLEDAVLFYPYYPKELADACLQIVISLESYHLYHIAAHYEVNVFHVLLATSYRMMNGYHLPAARNALKVDEVMALKNYLIAKDLLEMLAAKVFFTFTESDIYGLAVYLQANRLEFKPSRSHVEEEYHQIVGNMIRRMSECVHVDLSNDETLYEAVILHLYHMVYRLNHGIYIRNPLLEDIKTEFRLMFDLTWLVLEEESEAMGVELTEDEVAFLMLHFQNALDKAMKSRKVLVVCPKGIVSSGFIMSRIRRILPPLDIIEAVSANDVTRFDLEHVDLIISTIPLLDVEKPVVIVSPLITEKDLEMINRIYQEKLALPEKETTIVIKHLSAFIDPQYVFCAQQAQDARQIIETVTNQLLSDGYIQKGYQESLLEREANGGTELATGGAVPHGSMELVNQTIIPIWINKTPVKWGKYHVKVILFFVLAKKDLPQAKSLLEEIFKLIKSKHYIDTTLVLYQKQELLAILSGGNVH